MNGIYDFENHFTPHLDVEMLMKRKAEKQAQKMLIISGIATMLMAVLIVILLCLVAEVNRMLFIISSIVLCIYIIVGALFIGNVMKKKGDYIWEQE